MSESIFEYKIKNESNKSNYIFRLPLSKLDAIEVKDSKSLIDPYLYITVFFNGNKRELPYDEIETFERDVSILNGQLNKVL